MMPMMTLIFKLTLIAFLRDIDLSVSANAVGRIVDLSIDFEFGPTFNNNPGSTAIARAAAADPEIRTALVLEHGRIVAEYVKDGVDPDAPFDLWSCTKGWMNLLIGQLVDSGLLSLDDTLGDIWPDNSIWKNVTVDEVVTRKAITIRSILTMTSGLVDPTLPQPSNPLDLGDAGGASLDQSLSFPNLVKPGTFSYLSVSNILSYVVRERSGLSPREFAARTIFPVLGIQNDEISWWRNKDMMEYGYHGLRMNCHQMAKFGQLLLQGGLASPSKQLVSVDWVKGSLPHKQLEPDIDYPYYGFLLWGTEDYYCALGMGGQDVCIHPGLGRVSVQQRNYLDGSRGNLVVAEVALNNSLSFGNSNDDEESMPSPSAFFAPLLARNSTSGGSAGQEKLTPAPAPTVKATISRLETPQLGFPDKSPTSEGREIITLSSASAMVILSLVALC